MIDAFGRAGPLPAMIDIHPSDRMTAITGSQNRATVADHAKKQIDPRMHSAEHIVNQTMIRMFHCKRCFSAHLERKKSKLDYHFQRPLLDLELRELEKRVNEVLEADIPVAEIFFDRTEAESDYNLERLPEGAGEKIRIVRIGDYDACPCIGPHVRSTGEIGRFRLIFASFEEGTLRIRFRLSAVDERHSP